VTSSIAARAAQPRGENYAASKAAVEALVRGLAAELARHAIRANAIVPGWIRSPLADPLLDADAVREKVLPRVPMRRWGDPADFRGAAVFLASRASAYMTGQALVIDGGYPVF
jgi:NAD(P)-dependent dehydrogenase (short-subunit alcohol dehydrogenase family)